ncbi:MAG: nitroreductase family protein [Methanobacteriaceae archaeon]|jgi:nitroreductase|nr:nitroreductase family protein [Methanobacteriaceae archaeon]
MDLLEAMEKRHSVREYTDKKIEGEIKEELKSFIGECNRESGLKMQLILNEEEAFKSGIFAKFGIFKNVKNYIAIVARKCPYTDTDTGFYGEKVVLKATQLGLNTCWVAMTYDKNKVNVEINDDEKLVIVIAIGYGENEGKAHKSKTINKLAKFKGEMPDWFERGLKAAQLAPTAMNQQRFKFNLLSDGVVRAETSFGFYTKIDLGIAKYHFEIGADYSSDTKEWVWKY